ncbi:MAG: type I-C CRISPR-associated protein Cas5c [Burkholderiales bacterium]
MSWATYCLEVSGDFACFTRPEMKVERVSYDVMTPSAARAVFEAIFWKPAVRWRVRRIEVLKPIRWINLRRNEVGAVVSVRNVQTAMNGGDSVLALNIENERQQRAGLFLRDVAYRIHADLEIRADRLDPNPPEKFRAMFERRARAGQCVNQPYLGCREFAARFSYITDPATEPPPINETRDLGWMLLDLDFTRPNDPQPRFFRAQMTKGVIEVPPFEGEEVRR